MVKEEYLFSEETYKIIGAAMEVHRHLGPGFLESVYQEALEREFNLQDIPFVAQQKIQIEYKGEKLNQYYIADLICYDKIIVELKAISCILPIHEAQVINYLTATDLKVGLLLNFGETSLYHQRIIHTHKRPPISVNSSL